MSGKSWMAPLTGIAFIVVLIASFVVLGEEPPDPTDEGVQEVIDFYVDNEDAVFAAAVLQTLAGGLFVFFGGYLFKRLRAAGAEASAVVTLAGTIIFAIAAALDGTINIALAEAGDDLEPGAIEALSILWNNDFLPIALGMFVFLLGFGVAIVRHDVLPAWVGWVAIVAGLVAMSPLFFVPGVVAILLIVASSIMFARSDKAGVAAS